MPISGIGLGALGPDSVGTVEIKSGGVGTSEIINLSVLNRHLFGSIPTSKIPALSKGTPIFSIGAGSIGSPQLASGAVYRQKIKSGEIGSVHFFGAALNAVLHKDLITNPHSVTKSQVGVGSVDNYPQVKKAAASTGSVLPRWSGIAGDTIVNSSVTEANAADAVTKKHTQNTDKKIIDADSDTQIQVEESADEDIIRMDVAGVEAFKLNADGILDLAKQSGCRARLTSDQTIATGTITILSLATEDWDIQNEFNTNTYRFTATKAGKYAVATNARVDDLADGNYITIAVYKNGSLFGGYGQQLLGAAGAAIYGIADILGLAANDYLDFRIWHNYGANRTAPASATNNYMVISKIA